MSVKAAMCVAAAACALLVSGAATAGKKGSASVSVAPASGTAIEPTRLNEETAEGTRLLVKQVPICRVVNSVLSSPCGIKSMVDKVAPKFFPFSIKKFPVNPQSLDALRRMSGDFNIETDSYAPKEAYEIDFTIPSVRLGAIHTSRADAVAMDGTFEVGFYTPDHKLSSTKLVVEFSGILIVNAYPTASQCVPDENGGISKLYLTPIILSTKIRDLETVRPTWTKYALSDGAIKWMSNAMLKMAPAMMLGVDAFQGLKRLSSDGRFQPGFEVCIGPASSCKGKKKALKPPATVEVQAGELGHIDLTSGLSATPIVDDGGTGFVCKAIEAATAPYECRQPLMNAVIQNLLPITFPFPNEIIRGVTNGQDTTKAIVELAKAHVASATAEKGSFSVTTVVDQLNVISATSAGPPLSLRASADLHLTPICKDGSIKLSFAGTRMLDVGINNTTWPRWLQEGFGRAAVNANLPTIKICFDPLKVPYSDKVLNLCSLADKAFQTKSLGTVATIFAQGVLPITIEPWKLMPSEMRSDIGAMFLKDLSVGISNPVIVTGKSDTVTVDITVKKNGETTTLKGTKIDIGGVASCKKTPAYIQVTPSLETVAKNNIEPPKWVFQSSLVRLINYPLQHANLEVCLQGACKSQKVATTIAPVPALAPSVATDCAVSR